jgi:hydrogenase-4 component F
MLFVLIVVPLFMAGLVSILPNKRTGIILLIVTALFHLSCVISFWGDTPQTQWQNYLSLDVLGLLVLSIISTLFVAVSFYLIVYLRNEEDRSVRLFLTCLLAFLSTMTLVTVSRHLGLLWIAVEATTLFSAILINFHRTPQGIEATWKFLLICSVGVALALLGTLFMAVAATDINTLLLEDLLSNAPALDISWLKLSVIFLLVGYGTKMGLVPMHNWKPDTYGEAPGPVGALMSGALTSCAFLAILRVGQICHQANQMPFFQSITLLLGVLSLFVASIFILGQTDFKRMLGYSSIEHMGILVLGIGLGGAGFYGSLYHMLNNAFAKGLMFLVAGNFYHQYKTNKVKNIQGVLQSSPWTGALLLTGFLCVTGFPPFGTFFSELMILNAAITGKHYVVAFLYVVFLAVIFIGMSRIILKMALGVPPDKPKDEPFHESVGIVVPVVILGLIVLFLGIYMPPCVNEALQTASGLLGGQ